MQASYDPFGAGNNTEQDDREIDMKLEEVHEAAVKVDHFVVGDKLPVVSTENKEKLGKLEKVIHKVFSMAGTVVRLKIPSANGKTKGFAFVEYSDAAGARKATQNINGYKLDSKHKFEVYSFSEYEFQRTVNDEYVPPTDDEHTASENLREWLHDEDFRDQFALRFDESVSMHWMDAHSSPKDSLVASKEGWSDSYIKFSPQGSYFATFHGQGIALWGSSSWVKIIRFQHNNVELIDFSPCERYLVTYARTNETAESPQSVKIWDIRTGQMLRAFHAPPLTKEKQPAWPHFQWSFNGDYLARIAPDGDKLQVFASKDVSLLNRKSFKALGLDSFKFSPTSNHLCIATKEINDKPARVELLALPSLAILTNRNLFNVSSSEIVWHPDGTFVALKANRFKKKKQFVNIEIIRMTKKNFPIETLEILDVVHEMSWEGQGNRFSALVGASTRPNVHIYDASNEDIKLLKVLEGKECNAVFWSPTGKFCVLAAVKTGNLEFFNADELETVASEEHMFVTDISWDPSGRYLATYVSYFRHQHENSLNLWSACGDQLHVENRDRLYQFVWRPRPRSLLTQKQIKSIEQARKTWTQKFSLADDLRSESHLSGVATKRRELREEFMKFYLGRLEEKKQADEAFVNMRGGVSYGNEGDYVDWETVVEEVISVVEEPYKL
eukprot:TRINITY_DN1249_c0_g1_i2.p1 TRINITY_DN1249_c0_g1~~TRINITY_DN1249_c0_g1_i2.p1  ORF type:complete len:669 (-),score=230.10 TRINITY_DN1249_c0_g1_i2:36-2042(-)